jgi:orotate phosphoribosyltransferase
MDKYTKIHTVGTDVPLKIVKGHFATNHSHINYYIDSTTLRTRSSEAHEVAKVLAGMYLYDTVVDTIVCMEGTEVIGAFLSEELTNSGFLSTNAHKTIYVVSPEFNNNSQLIFRENLIPEIAGKHVMILMAMVTTGKTLGRALECVKYYNGILTGVSAIFGENDVIDGVPVHAVFSKRDLPDYEAYDYRECPMCKAGQKLDALVNAYGFEPLN